MKSPVSVIKDWHDYLKAKTTSTDSQVHKICFNFKFNVKATVATATNYVVLATINVAYAK